MKRYRGTIKNGKVVLQGADLLPEGAKVELSIINGEVGAKAAKSIGPRRSRSRKLSLAERLAAVVGKAKSLPPDAAAQHDHYLYGLPKRR